MAIILVIDDEPQLRRLLRRILEGAGHRVIEAGEGGIGLEEFRQNAVDLVITDLIMPGSKGFEVIREIKEHRAATGVIAMSGGGGYFVPEACLTVARKLGADSILRKPFGVDEVLQTVDRALGGRDRLRSLA